MLAVKLGALGLLTISSPRGSRSSGGASAASVWGLLPEQLGQMGVASPVATFTELQRPWRWRPDGPLLARRTRELLHGPGLSLPEICERHRSADGSTKLLLASAGDSFEAVHMPRSVGRGRVTLCISSQVGCAMGCTFCATAKMGFRRHLTAGEIVGQVLSALSALGPRQPGELTLVFMGMGEPLHNLGHVAQAIEVLCRPEGLGLSPKRVTVSSSGLVPELFSLGQLRARPLLAVSLNATTDDVRREIMPIGRRYALAELRAALEGYPLRPRERITIEYVLLAGINDSVQDAERLADFCATFPHNINLIPFNEHALSPFKAPSESEVSRFAKALLARRPSLVTVRRSRGRDIQGACGQLVQR